MIFNEHTRLRGKHAAFSASKYHWTNYDDEKFERVFLASLAAQRGTRLHALASEAIDLGVKLPRRPETLNRYVNDALMYHMIPEQILYYSDNFFGTVDAISFHDAKYILRIHDLKTGETPGSMRQLLVYAALFCLEYEYDPHEIKTELRLYQNNAVATSRPEPEDISEVMGKIINFDRRIEAIVAQQRRRGF